MSETTQQCQTFREWLALQIHRTDAAGRLARDVASETKRIGRVPLINDRRAVRWYARAIPRDVGLSEAAALEVWKEWLASRE